MVLTGCAHSPARNTGPVSVLSGFKQSASALPRLVKLVLDGCCSRPWLTTFPFIYGDEIALSACKLAALLGTFLLEVAAGGDSEKGVEWRKGLGGVGGQ